MTYGKALLIAILFSTAFVVTGTMDYNTQTAVLANR